MNNFPAFKDLFGFKRHTMVEIYFTSTRAIYDNRQTWVYFFMNFRHTTNQEGTLQLGLPIFPMICTSSKKTTIETETSHPLMEAHPYKVLTGQWGAKEFKLVQVPRGK